MSQLEDLIIATNSNIFVNPDPISGVIGVGLGGLDLTAPERFADRVAAGKCRTGVVTQVGWDVAHAWPGLVGTRIAWPPYVGTEFTPAGGDKRVQLAGIHEIMCWFSDDHPDINEGPLNEKWLDALQARPGTLLVERVEPPSYRGSIVIPAGIRTSVRQSEALIAAVGEGVDKATYFPGRRVFLPAESNKRIELGDRIFYQIFSNAIVGIFKDEAEGFKVDEQEVHPALKMYGAEDVEERFDDGDPRRPM